MSKDQKVVFDSGNELAAYAAKQIGYHVMGYYPITPSTQIAESLDAMRAEGQTDIALIAAEGEHSAAGICYGASAAGGRVFNATSANGLLYAIEELPVQSGTRFPMVMNVACRTVSGPLSIKGDHSDIMYTLNTGWLILFADEPQAVYDFNICALKAAERVKLPAIVAFDGFFTSHQKRKCSVFSEDQTVADYVGKWDAEYSVLDLEHPVSIGSYMNEPDIMDNKYQLHLAMEEAKNVIPEIFREYEELSGRKYSVCEGYRTEDADFIYLFLGSSFHTVKYAADRLREKGIKAGAATLHVLRPFPSEEIAALVGNAGVILVGDRQDSYGAGGGNLSLEIRAALQGRAALEGRTAIEGHTALQSAGSTPRVVSRVYGLGGRDFYAEDALALYEECSGEDAKSFDYYGVEEGTDQNLKQYFAPITEKKASPGIISCEYDGEEKKMKVKTGTVAQTTAIEKRLAPGHGACPGCGIPVNVNLLLRGIEGNVVLLFQTGCGMVVTTGYPKTSFKVPYIHNLFQNGAATLSGVVEMFHQRQKRGEYPEGEITFVMVSGDGGLDIGMGSALGTALRNHGLIIFEYDNGGYMNTGYQLSYSTPKGAKSSTSHVGKDQYGKRFFHKDMPEIMAATHMPYVATAAESNPVDFIRKAAKAGAYARRFGTAYVKALSACPLNWNDSPDTERQVIGAAVDCCYFPLYEVEQGITTLSYDPEKAGKKIPVADWFAMMGRTKHLKNEKYADIVEGIQNEVDRRFLRLKARAESEVL